MCVLSAPFPLPVSDLQFKDCRLLEKWSNKEESLQQLVAALKEVASLHTLSLAQNRLGKRSILTVLSTWLTWVTLELNYIFCHFLIDVLYEMFTSIILRYQFMLLL